MTTLLIDNYDSYTYIIAQYLWEVNGERPIVIKNDAMSVQTLSALSFDNIVISPGPGTPEHYPDVMLSMDVLSAYQNVPILGICLGHQCMGAFFGGRIIRAPREQHGKYAQVTLSPSPLFEGIPTCINVVRYHSLVIDKQSLPACLKPIAHTHDADAVVMAVQHQSLPMYGVQFHPESIGTEYGKVIIQNFRTITEAWLTRRHSASSTLQSVDFQQIPLPWAAPDYIYEKFFCHPYSFWLDSSRVGHNGRYSFMGVAQRVLYSENERVHQQKLTPDGNNQWFDLPLLDVLKQQMDLIQLADSTSSLPFKGGWVGYLAYDFARLKGYPIRQRELSYPEGLFMWVDRFMAFDHETQEMWLCGLVSDESSAAELTTWSQQIADVVHTQGKYKKPVFLVSDEGATTDADPIPLLAAQSKEQYISNIQTIKEYLKNGDSYEVCLTNEFELRAESDPLRLYKVLRTTNPAPYSSFIRLADISFLSSSPECFISIDQNQQIKSEPIKGTWPKTNDPVENEHRREAMLRSEKDRSELLMITDLIRNDLSMYCRKGTVETPRPVMVTEYATVNQLSSVITGTLQIGIDPLNALGRLFPGGSITGAPKFRTISIIDQLEQRPRGLYTGSIGYVSVDNQADFNIAIRTMVHDRQKGTISFGAGGAITAESEPVDEYHEILLKAYALLRAVYLSCYNQFEHYRLSYREQDIQQKPGVDTPVPHVDTTPATLEKLFTTTMPVTKLTG